MAWLQANVVWILSFVIALDTALAQIPQLQSNSTFQLISGWIKNLAALFAPKPPAP